MRMSVENSQFALCAVHLLCYILFVVTVAIIRQSAYHCLYLNSAFSFVYLTLLLAQCQI